MSFPQFWQLKTSEITSFFQLSIFNFPYDEISAIKKGCSVMVDSTIFIKKIMLNKGFWLLL
jgi:hypothetical protein